MKWDMPWKPLTPCAIRQDRRTDRAEARVSTRKDSLSCKLERTGNISYEFMGNRVVE